MQQPRGARVLVAVIDRPGLVAGAARLAATPSSGEPVGTPRAGPDGGAGFQTLFMAQFGAMVALARLLGAEDPDAIAQEAFLRLHAAWSSLRDPGAATGYLRKTVVNLSRNSLRHTVVARRHTPSELPSMPSAEASALARSDVLTVLGVIRRLPRRRREALILRHWLGLSYEEIAHALGVTAGGARSLVHRALADVQRTINEP